MDVYRTRDEGFAGLLGLPWEPRYRLWEGSGSPTSTRAMARPVLLHGRLV